MTERAHQYIIPGERLHTQLVLKNRSGERIVPIRKTSRILTVSLHCLRKFERDLLTESLNSEIVKVMDFVDRPARVRPFKVCHHRVSYHTWLKVMENVY